MTQPHDDHSATPDTRTLAANLEPALREACEGRLSGIEWFTSSWQRGGSATGAAVWTREDGTQTSVIVKIPVGPVEFDWTNRLGRVGAVRGPTPRVFAAGDALGGYDLGWLVMERIAGRPMANILSPEALDSLLTAVAAFYVRAAQVKPVGAAPRAPDWELMLSKARQAVKDAAIDNAQHWNESLKRVQRALPKLDKFWSQRPIDTWCHGDLHPGNALVRDDGEACILIDLSHVHAGHWVEDAVYLEKVYWSKPEALGGIKPVSALAKCCREAGVGTNLDYAALASVRRVWIAAMVPLHLETQGHPKFMQAALEQLDRSLGNLGA